MSSTIKVNNIQNLAGDDSGIDLSTNDQIILKTANTTAITVNSSQNVALASTASVSGLLTASSGVAIGGTGSANTLNDYEEGTFTPTFSSGYSSISYATQVGFYTKIGNTVRAYFQIGLSSATAGGTGVVVAGLPFTSLNNNDVYVTGTHYVNTASNPNGDAVKPILFPNTNGVYMYYQSTTGVTQLVGTNLGTGFTILCTVIYETAS